VQGGDDLPERGVDAARLGLQPCRPGVGHDRPQLRAARGVVDRRGRRRVVAVAGVGRRERADRLAQRDRPLVVGGGDPCAAVEQAGVGEPVAQGGGAAEQLRPTLEVDAVDEPLDEPQRARGRAAVAGLGCHTLKTHSPVSCRE
jgi:hypothetical protein